MTSSKSILGEYIYIVTKNVNQAKSSLSYDVFSNFDVTLLQWEIVNDSQAIVNTSVQTDPWYDILLQSEPELPCFRAVSINTVLLAGVQAFVRKPVSPG